MAFILTTFVEIILNDKKCVIITMGDEKMRIDFILNELEKKINFTSIIVESICLKELDKKSKNRL